MNKISDKLRLKLQTTIYLLFYIQSSICIAQTSPIEWINNSYNINIEPSSNTKDFPFERNRTKYVNFTFKNVGSHVTFIDTTFLFDPNNHFITKPNDIQTISLHKDNFGGFTSRINKDTTIYLLLPFYYEGKIFTEKVACNFTFEKSKLIKHDNLQIDATPKVEKIIETETIKNNHNNPPVQFTHYFSITNISNKPIYCTKKIVAWNDYQIFRNNGYFYEKVLPGQTYQIPAELNMDRKYRFKRSGIIEVFGDDISETFECEVFSDFKQ